MVRRLQADTPARIALMSLPLISEDLDHPVNQRADEYSDCVRALAGEWGVSYLPLRELQKAYLAATPGQRGQPYENTGRIGVTSILWSFLGLSWDKIAERYGQQLTVDNLHSTSRTARMMADLVEGFMQASA